MTKTMKFSKEIGPIHFIGIGGIGMSGIAEVMASLGYSIQGSDLFETANVERLRKKGIDVKIGHAASHLGDARVVVVSSAIRPDNPELERARACFLPIVRRAEMLGELMRFKSAIAVGGTHGKTTTTSMVGALLEGGGYDPTVINGGIINAYGTNTRLGNGDWIVVESDESDGSFTKLPSDIVIVTNIDPEHLDYYGSFEAAKNAYRTFIQNIPFYGFAVMCSDHPEVHALIEQIEDRRILTYGTNPQADFRLLDWHTKGGKSRFSVEIRDRHTQKHRTLSDITLSMPGLHNALNATAALAVAYEIGVDAPALLKTLANFSGVKRRFSFMGSVAGVSIYDDYGHHPVEIKVVLKAARGILNTGSGIIAVVQPHRYTRLSSLFEEFCLSLNEADCVVVAPVYAAGEEPIDGVDHEALVQGLKIRGHKHVYKISSPDELAPLIFKIAKPDDCVICLGAGSITYWAQKLPQELEELNKKA